MIDRTATAVADADQTAIASSISHLIDRTDDFNWCERDEVLEDFAEAVLDRVPQNTRAGRKEFFVQKVGNRLLTPAARTSVFNLAVGYLEEMAQDGTHPRIVEARAFILGSRPTLDVGIRTRATEVWVDMLRTIRDTDKKWVTNRIYSVTQRNTTREAPLETRARLLWTIMGHAPR